MLHDKTNKTYKTRETDKNGNSGSFFEEDDFLIPPPNPNIIGSHIYSYGNQ